MEDVNITEYPPRRMLVVIITCTISLILGLSMVTKGGKDMLDLIIEANTSWNILFIALLEVLFITWVYGADKFWDNIEEMGMKRRPCIKTYWIICWKFIAPSILIILVIASFVSDVIKTNQEIEDSKDKIIYNGLIRWLITLTSFGIILGFAIHEVIKRRRNNEELGTALLRPRLSTV